MDCDKLGIKRVHPLDQIFRYQYLCVFSSHTHHLHPISHVFHHNSPHHRGQPRYVRIVTQTIRNTDPSLTLVLTPGIGRGLTELFLSRPNHTVIAATRDPASSSSLSLNSVPTGKDTKLILVKIDSTSDTDAADAITKIQSAGVDHLDIVIANAGIAATYSTAHTIKVGDLRQLFEVNTVGPLKLFEAAYPLLKAAGDKKGAGTPKFVGVGSNVGSIQDVELVVPYLSPSYGASKAALNYLVRYAHAENDWLTAFVINPGFAQTDMGAAAAKHFGLDKAWVTLKDSTEGIVKFVSLFVVVVVVVLEERAK